MSTNQICSFYHRDRNGHPCSQGRGCWKILYWGTIVGIEVMTQVLLSPCLYTFVYQLWLWHKSSRSLCVDSHTSRYLARRQWTGGLAMYSQWEPMATGPGFMRSWFFFMSRCKAQSSGLSSPGGSAGPGAQQDRSCCFIWLLFARSWLLARLLAVDIGFSSVQRHIRGVWLVIFF